MGPWTSAWISTRKSLVIVIVRFWCTNQRDPKGCLNGGRFESGLLHVGSRWATVLLPTVEVWCLKRLHLTWPNVFGSCFLSCSGFSLPLCQLPQDRLRSGLTLSGSLRCCSLLCMFLLLGGGSRSGGVCGPLGAAVPWDVSSKGRGGPWAPPPRL